MIRNCLSRYKGSHSIDMCSQSLGGYGMKWFIILACLVAAQFAHGATVQKVRGKSNSNLELKLQTSYRDLLNCTVTNNEGKKFILIPPEKNKNERYIRNLFSLYGECKPEILMTSSEMNGKWTVEQIFYENIEESTKQKTVSEEFNIEIQILETRDIVPEKTLTIYEGNYAIVKLAEEFPKLNSCILINIKDELEHLPEENSYLRIQEDGVCGIRMKVQKNHSEGNWKLYANVGSAATYYGTFTINVLEQNKEDRKSEVVYFQLGEKAELTFSSSNMRMTFCQIEDPTGKKFEVNEKCNYEIPFVTKLHEGVWKFLYGIEGSNIPMKYNLRVITFENSRLNSTVTFGPNKSINLLCRIRGIRDVQYCRFTRPNNMSFSVTPGVGNERYEYYGMGFQPSSMFHEQVSDCGLTIRSPSPEDFGIWKCLIKIGDKVTGAILQINNTQTPYNKNIKTYGSKVYVQRGDQFAVKCSAEAKLDYCWMLSPNGTVYSVSEKGSSPSHLFYVGSGLELGECGATVTVADDTHLGEWSCRMGVVNGTEVEASVSVTVTDSLLIADENTIDISSKKPTILTCRTLPGYETTISYCRWIRPDGRGIHNHADNQYVTERTLSSCKLTIQELNIGYDIGSWSCIAGIAGPKTIEATSQIQINYSYMGLGGFVVVALTIALLVITTITLFVIIVRKRRIRYPDEKCIIYK